MSSSLRRQVLPILDWGIFLKDGKNEFNNLFEFKSTKQYGKEHFDFLKTLGKGAFGRVYLTKKKDTGNYYAIKIQTKADVVKQKQVKHVVNEKKILQALNFPYCVYLEHAFQDNSYLYLCLPFITGGELFTHLTKLKKFAEPLSKFYGAQVLLAFEYLHYCDMLFRDLKPENILIDEKGYLKITDFGFCKIVKTRTYTLCGTPEYLAPEVILNKGYGKSADWWSYGVLLFELTAGYPPFQARDHIKIFEKVMRGAYNVPKFFSPNLVHLIQNLLQIDLSRRFGILKDGINDIKNHSWYKDMNWLALLNGKISAPYLPRVTGAGDSSNFLHYPEQTIQVAKNDLFSMEFKDF